MITALALAALIASPTEAECSDLETCRASLAEAKMALIKAASMVREERVRVEELRRAIGEIRVATSTVVLACPPPVECSSRPVWVDVLTHGAAVIGGGALGRWSCGQTGPGITIVE